MRHPREGNAERRGWRALGFPAMLLAAVLVAVELVSSGLYLILEHRLYRAGKAREALRAVAEPSGREGRVDEPSLQFRSRREIIHPFLGTVWETDRRARLTPNDLEFHGFVPDAGMVKGAHDERRLRIAVCGGSVAESFAEGEGVVALGAALLRSGALGGRTPEVLTLAMAGWKQPQQLAALSYVLALGAKIDVVLNIDGYNEVVLPPLDNEAHGVAPFYPRRWYLRAGELDPEQRADVGRLAFTRGCRRRLGEVVSAWHLELSPTLFLLWRGADRKLQRDVAAAERKLLDGPGGDRSFTATGPYHRHANDVAMSDAHVAYWASCSRQMRALCEGQGILYEHVLQPNQWFPGGKPMTPEERRVAGDESQPYARSARARLPLLLPAGTKLARDGEHFHDLSRLFAATDEPIFTDSCCHINAEGNRAMGEAIADALAADLTPQPSGRLGVGPR